MNRISRMMATVQLVLALLRTLLAVVAFVFILAVGYWAYHLWHDKQRYEQYLYNVLSEQRVAEACVLRQERPDGQPVQTTLRFQEFRPNGEALSPITVTLPGEEIYIDALVTVFDSEAVQAGQAKSLYLFRRIFTEKVAPAQGVSLYRGAHTHDGIPQAFLDDAIEPRVQRRVWEHLWSLIESPAYAQAHGARTQFGQAVYARMAAGACYTVTLQNHGGLLLTE